MGSSLYVAGFCVTALRLRPVKEKWGGPKQTLKVSAYRTITNPVPRLALSPIMDPPRDPDSGPSRKLIIAFDIGTTFSRAAYAISRPIYAPKAKYVTWQALLPIPDPVTTVTNKTQALQ